MDKLYVDCLCSSEQHVLRFALDDWYEGEKNIFVATFLPNVPFFKRLQNATKYLFGYKCKYGHFEETLLATPDQIWPIMDLFEKVIEDYDKRGGSAS